MHCGRRSSRRAVLRGFTLIELLVSISIIAILLSLVLPMAGRTIAASRGFKCQQSLRSAAYDFQVFADDTLHGFRGNNTRSSTDRLFELENFVESQYSVDEFWAWPGETRRDFPDAAGNDPMRCPEVKGMLTLRRDQPCTNGAVGPLRSVSFGFNIRLRVAERDGLPVWVSLSHDILSAERVPLVWDVDGAAAVANDQLPHFSGPSLDSPAVFANDRYWFPGLRHNGAGNFAFMDGHVESSARPLDQPTWDWAYSPRR